MTKLLVFGSLLMSLLWIGCKGKQAVDTNSVQEAATGKKADTLQPVKTIVFFGNSLTAGYGLEPAESYPSLIQQKIDSAGWRYKTINAGVSGETSAGGKSRIEWILKNPVDVFVLELGANDGLRGVPISETKKNLQNIIDQVKTRYPQAQLVMAGMQVPPNMGARYANDFRDMYKDLASKNNMALIPFLLEGVGGVRELNLPDGIHPNVEGAKLVSENVWQVLQSTLQ